MKPTRPSVLNGALPRPAPGTAGKHWILRLVVVAVAAGATVGAVELQQWNQEGDQPHPVRRESAQFFLDRVRKPQANVEVALPDAAQRIEVPGSLGDAEMFRQDRVAQAARLTTVTGEVADEAAGQPVASHTYIQDAGGPRSPVS
jgi:hypothetical protein